MHASISSGHSYNKRQGLKSSSSAVEVTNPNKVMPHYAMPKKLSASYDSALFSHGLRVDHYATERDNKGLDAALDQTLERLERSRQRIEFQREQELYAYRKQSNMRRMVDRLLDSDLVKTGAAVVEVKMHEYEEEVNAWRVANLNARKFLTPSGRSTSTRSQQQQSSGRSTGSPSQSARSTASFVSRGRVTTPQNTQNATPQNQNAQAAISRANFASSTPSASSQTPRFYSSDDDDENDDAGSSADWREHDEAAPEKLAHRMSESAGSDSGFTSAPLSALVSRRPSRPNVNGLVSKPKVKWADDENARLLAIIGKNIRERAEGDGTAKKRVEVRPPKPKPADEDVYDLLRSNYTKVVKDAEEDAIYREQAMLPQFFALRKNGTTESPWKRSATAFSGPTSSGNPAARGVRRSVSALALSSAATTAAARIAKLKRFVFGEKKRKVLHYSRARLEELARPRAATFLIACQMTSARLLSRSRATQNQSQRANGGPDGGGPDSLALAGRVGMSSAKGRQEQLQDALDLDYALATSPFVKESQQLALNERRARSAREYDCALTRARSFCRELDAERKVRLLREPLSLA